jgi:hypothetical protein
MKTERLNYALVAGIVALAALLLSGVYSGLGIEAVVGYGAVVALLAVAALEYRGSWKSLERK